MVYNVVKDIVVYFGDVVVIFGVGFVGQMVGVFVVGEGVSKVIFVDIEFRLLIIKLRWFKQYWDKIEVLDFKQFSFGVISKDIVVSKLKELIGGCGLDVVIECVVGEYVKGWMYWLEMSLGVEMDMSEIINEMIEGVRNYGCVGVIGVYVGYVCFIFFYDYNCCQYVNFYYR